jgi:hypothetical protein
MYYLFGGLDYSQRDRYQSYHNNLLGILGLAFENGCEAVDYGQTAETAKIRLGGKTEERLMFMYLQKPVGRVMLKLLSPAITYLKKPPEAHVFREQVEKAEI